MDKIQYNSARPRQHSTPLLLRSYQTIPPLSLQLNSSFYPHGLHLRHHLEKGSPPQQDLLVLVQCFQTLVVSARQPNY